MNRILFVLLYVITFHVAGQDITAQLVKIKSAAEANEFVKSYPGQEAEVFTVNSERDTLKIHKLISEKKAGNVFSVKGYTFKIIESSTESSFRASYVYLDGGKYSMPAIDSLRDVIISQYKNGIPFTDLVKKYTMDSNPTGDLGWFTKGMMVPDFENAVKQHKKGDIFKINIPSKKWYYVTLKTFEDRSFKSSTVLSIRNK